MTRSRRAYDGCKTLMEPKIVVQSSLTDMVPDVAHGEAPLLVWSRHPAYPDGWWLVYWGELDGQVGSVQHRIGGERENVEAALDRARTRLRDIG